MPPPANIVKHQTVIIEQVRQPGRDALGTAELDIDFLELKRAGQVGARVVGNDQRAHLARDGQGGVLAVITGHGIRLGPDFGSQQIVAGLHDLGRHLENRQAGPELDRLVGQPILVGVDGHPALDRLLIAVADHQAQGKHAALPHQRRDDEFLQGDFGLLARGRNDRENTDAHLPRQGQMLARRAARLVAVGHQQQALLGLFGVEGKHPLQGFGDIGSAAGVSLVRTDRHADRGRRAGRDKQAGISSKRQGRKLLFGGQVAAQLGQVVVHPLAALTRDAVRGIQRRNQGQLMLGQGGL